MENTQEITYEYEDDEQELEDSQQESQSNRFRENERDIAPEKRKEYQIQIEAKRKRKQKKLMQKKIESGESSSSEDDLPLEKMRKLTINEKAQINSKSPKTNETNEMPEDEQNYFISVTAKKNSQQGEADMVFFNKTCLIIQKYCYQYKLITKLKLLSQNPFNEHFKIKLQYQKQQQLFLGASQKVLVKNMTLHYYVFAKIICEKLGAIGIQVKEANIASDQGVPQKIIVNSLIHGKILKKSQLMGKWKQRFIVINKKGIYSYKKMNKKHTMFIPSGSIKQMWTRFKIIEDKILVIKIMHGSRKTKTEFGIPITNFLSTTVKSNWLWQIYKKTLNTA